jgi:hypothetical protein
MEGQEKGKSGKRDESFIPPFFRRNPNIYQQFQAAQNDSKMAKYFGKIPRPSIKCWG